MEEALPSSAASSSLSSSSREEKDRLLSIRMESLLRLRNNEAALLWISGGAVVNDETASSCVDRRIRDVAIRMEVDRIVALDILPVESIIILPRL